MKKIAFHWETKVIDYNNKTLANEDAKRLRKLGWVIISEYENLCLSDGFAYTIKYEKQLGK